MKTRLFLYLALILALLGCSLFSNQSPASSDNPSSDPPANEKAPAQEISTEGWLLPDPTIGLEGLDRYHQELTISFQGTLDGAAYEWTNSYQHDVWKKDLADFWTMKTSETGAEPAEILVGTVDQAHYSRREAGAACQVWWGEVAEGTGGPQQPAEILPPVAEAAETGTETINDMSVRHYTISQDESETKAAGDVWLAESGRYVVRYVLTFSAKEGQQRYEYNLSQVNSTGEVIYPDGCSAVLADFPVMDGARNLHRLPNAVDYTVSAETDALSQFYQDELVAQGWTFVAAHDNDPKNVTLIFTNEDQGKAASILLSVQDKDVWVSAMLRPWEPASDTQ
jgi:hypothetical protein